MERQHIAAASRLPVCICPPQAVPAFSTAPAKHGDAAVYLAACLPAWPPAAIRCMPSAPSILFMSHPSFHPYSSCHTLFMSHIHTLHVTPFIPSILFMSHPSFHTLHVTPFIPYIPCLSTPPWVPDYSPHTLHSIMLLPPCHTLCGIPSWPQHTCLAPALAFVAVNDSPMTIESSTTVSSEWAATR
jgi:hypothetical protein